MRWKLGRSKASADAEAESSSPRGKSISQRGMKNWSPGCLAGFFSVFLLAGLGFLLFFLLPAIKVVRAMNWEATDCAVERAWVESHTGDDSTTYSIEVEYRYVADGVEYRGSRYEFMGGSSSGYDSKKKVVDALEEAGSTTCYYDPEDPSSSVVHRGWSWVYLLALFPLVFVAIGGGGMIFALTSKRVKAAAARSRPPADSETSSATYSPKATLPIGSFQELDEWSTPVVEEGPVELEESLGPIGKLLGIIGIALFWNGIVSVFVWQAWQGWREGEGFEASCLTLFLVPFVLIGLLLLAGIPYQLLALANPRPRLTLSRAAVPLGGSAQLSWRFRGVAGRIGRLRIYLEGAESARYRRGTDTHTDTEVFATIDLVDRGRGMPVANGAATLELPPDTMHSFDGGNNKIVWKLKVHGEIVRWPDVLSEFPFVVQPGGE